MKKISTVAIERIQIFKENQLTIGLDLGDRTSHYCILNEAGEVILELRTTDHTERNRGSFQQDSSQSDRARNRDAFTVGQPAVDPVGTRSDRSPCAQRTTDRGEQPKR